MVGFPIEHVVAHVDRRRAASALMLHPDEAIEAAKAAFFGNIMQQPPMYSAVSIKGERLYVAARKGENMGELHI